MYEKTMPFNWRPGRRALAPLAIGVLMALVVLGMATLAAAQTQPVSVTKTVDPGEVPTGSLVLYTVVFSNTSAGPVDLQPIQDTLPAGFSFSSMGPGDTNDPPDGTTGTITWDGPYTVPPTDTFTISYWVYVGAPPNANPYLNHVTAHLSTGETIEDQVGLMITGPHLTINKTAPVGQIPDRSPLDYTVTLENDGSTAATVAAITDTLPGHFTFLEMVSGAVPTPVQQGQQLIWSGPINLGTGESVQFTYRVKADGTVGQLHTNSVRASYDGLQAGPATFSVLVTRSYAKAYVPLVVKTVIIPPPQVVRKLAYQTKPGDNFDIYSIEVDGTDALNISARSGGDLNPDWSPDGNKVAWEHYSGNAEIYVGDADGTDVYNATGNEADDLDPDWSPDGTKILFRSERDGRWDLFVMNADGSGQQKLTGGRNCQSTLGKWSPDGTKIGFICGLDTNADVFVMNADGSGQVQLTSDSDEDKALSWSPDSTRLVYVRDPNDDDSEIWAANVTTGETVRITTNGEEDFSPVYSPDGTQVLFAHEYGGVADIVVMPAGGGDLTRLTNTPEGEAVPQWSPDGDMIAFIRNLDGNKELYVMNADGTGQLRLTNTAEAETNFDWWPITP